MVIGIIKIGKFLWFKTFIILGYACEDDLWTTTTKFLHIRVFVNNTHFAYVMTCVYVFLIV